MRESGDVTLTEQPSGRVFVGTAGWSLSKENKDHFPADSSHLASYSRRLNAVEINSSFYRPHRAATYSRWGGTVPPEFRFSVKGPRAITHERRLKDVGELLREFFSAVAHLKEKLGIVLWQFPPSFAFESKVVGNFLECVRAQYAGNFVIEPRHASWFTPEASEVILKFDGSYVVADPPAGLGTDGGTETNKSVKYFRLHGSPKIYYSNYEPNRLAEFSHQINRDRAQRDEVWCVFDNTAEGFATTNALTVQSQMNAFALKAVAEKNAGK